MLTPKNYIHYKNYQQLNKITHLEIWNNNGNNFNFPISKGKFFLVSCTDTGVGFVEMQFNTLKALKMFVAVNFIGCNISLIDNR